MSTDTPTKSIVMPFAVEADHPRCADLLLQSIPNCRLRSSIASNKQAKDAKSGELMTPLDQARHLATFPRTPGMQLHVNPVKLTYAIIDPLYDDEDLSERIQNWFNRNHGVRMDTKLRGQAPIKGQIDKHRMKTLIRELHFLLEAGEIQVVKGDLPTIEEVQELPGHYMLNPGSRVANFQPRFEKDLDEYVENLGKQGG